MLQLSTTRRLRSVSCSMTDSLSSTPEARINGIVNNGVIHHPSLDNSTHELRVEVGRDADCALELAQLIRRTRRSVS